MKICLACSTKIDGATWRCPSCGLEPAQTNGVQFFAPHISGVTESYDPGWYADLALLEAGNFWFRARNQLIDWLARRYCRSRGNYLEVGCGTGFVLQMLCAGFPQWSVFATEAQPEGIEFAANRVPAGVTFYQMDACSIPFRNEFDAIGAFDVIEHIRDDTKAIAEIYAALMPGGIFLMSVPQHMFLWSKYDEIGCHFRRYSSAELEEKLNAAGFTVRFSTSFNSLLLPLMMLSRYFMREKDAKSIDVLDELRLSKITNLGLSAVLKIEFCLLRVGIKMPFGGSRMIVAQKALAPGI